MFGVLRSLGAVLESSVRARAGGIDGWVVAQGLANRAGTRCEHVRVRSPSPSMAQDGPGPIGQTLCIKSSAKFLIRSRAFSRARHAVGCLGCCLGERGRVWQGRRTRAYRDVFTACPVPTGNTQGLPNSQITNHKPQSSTSNEQRATSNEQRATSNECEETTGQSRKQYASALPR